MTALLVLVGTLVAVAAGVRSTWSPCGLSMLSTITPMSERAKGHSYRATASWFVVGAAAGGVTLGGLSALGALAVRLLGPSPLALAILAVGSASLAALSDLAIRGLAVPIHRRQVNERWLDQLPAVGLRRGVRLADRRRARDLHHHRRGLPDGGPRGTHDEPGRSAGDRYLFRSGARARGAPHPLDHHHFGADRVPPTVHGHGAEGEGVGDRNRDRRRRGGRCQPCGCRPEGSSLWCSAGQRWPGGRRTRSPAPSRSDSRRAARERVRRPRRAPARGAAHRDRSRLPRWAPCRVISPSGSSPRKAASSTHSPLRQRCNVP